VRIDAVRGHLPEGVDPIHVRPPEDHVYLAHAQHGGLHHCVRYMDLAQDVHDEDHLREKDVTHVRHQAAIRGRVVGDEHIEDCEPARRLHEMSREQEARGANAAPNVSRRQPCEAQHRPEDLLQPGHLGRLEPRESDEDRRRDGFSVLVDLPACCRRLPVDGRQDSLLRLVPLEEQHNVRLHVLRPHHHLPHLLLHRGVLQRKPEPREEQDQCAAGHVAATLVVSPPGVRAGVEVIQKLLAKLNRRTRLETEEAPRPDILQGTCEKGRRP